MSYLIFTRDKKEYAGWGVVARGLTVSDDMIIDIVGHWTFPHLNPIKYNVTNCPSVIYLPMIALVSLAYLPLFLKNRSKEIICNSEHLIPVALIISILTRRKVIAISHGSYLPIFARHKIFCWFLSRLDGLVFVSQYTKDMVTLAVQSEYLPDNLKVINLGVNQDQFYQDLNLNRTKKILFVGNSKPRKGLNILIEALKRIRDKPLHLCIVGTITDQDKITLLGIPNLELVLEQNVSIERLRWHYQTASCNVLVSQHVGNFFEGFGLIHAEAIACGCFTIGSNVSGNVDIINVEQGAILSPDDSVGLANILLERIQGPNNVKCSGTRNWLHVRDELVHFLGEIK